MASVVASLALLATLAGHAPVRVAGALWSAPVGGRLHVVEAFDPPPQRWMPGQRGVVLAGRAGERVRAAGDGVVSFAGPVGGVPVVAVRHPDGLETTYEPVRAEVHTGDVVARADVLGVLVPAGSECAPDACLHWGLKRGADYLDPLALLGLDRVRLLPMPSTVPVAQVRPAGAAAAAGAVALGVTGLAATRRAGRRRSRG